jgi:hypothetical protein
MTAVLSRRSLVAEPIAERRLEQLLCHSFSPLLFRKNVGGADPVPCLAVDEPLLAQHFERPRGPTKSC